MLATVISTAVPGQAVVDAGSKALGREPLPAGDEAGFGCLLERTDIRVIRMSEEHGILDLRGSDWQPKVGDVVRIVPNHVCVVVNMVDRMIAVRGDKIVDVLSVAARGRLA